MKKYCKECDSIINITDFNSYFDKAVNKIRYDKCCKLCKNKECGNNKDISKRKKICKQCNKSKNIEVFAVNMIKGDIIYYKPLCRICISENKKQKYLKKKTQIIDNKRICIKCGILKELNETNFQPCTGKYGNELFEYTCKNCRHDRAKELREIEENKERKRNLGRIRCSKRRQEDIIYRLHSNISRSFRYMLKSKGLNKNGKSYSEILCYSDIEIKEHLESLFEPWMTWNNWGIYNVKTWDDNDKSTWTWNVDHIKPISHFTIVSLNDPQIKECWALSNLRPYSAKQNIIDGNRRQLLLK